MSYCASNFELDKYLVSCQGFCDKNIKKIGRVKETSQTARDKLITHHIAHPALLFQEELVFTVVIVQTLKHIQIHKTI